MILLFPPVTVTLAAQERWPACQTHRRQATPLPEAQQPLQNLMKSRIGTIVCGTDFSDNARSAADAAAALAAKLGAQLKLVHGSVIADSPMTMEHLQTEAARLRAGGAALEAEIVEGEADEALVHSAQAHGAGLIVLSSLGRRAPVRWLLGSIAERTAESAPVPTLVVRKAAPLLEWSRGTRPLRVFVCMDFSRTSEAALRWAGALRDSGPCEITAAFADWTPEQSARLGVPVTSGILRNPPEVQAILESQVSERVRRILGSPEVNVIVRGGLGRADAQLASLAAEAGADVIVVGTHQRHGLGRLGHASISRGILHYASTNVLCVPPAAVPPPAQAAARECRRVLAAVDLAEHDGAAAAYAAGICAPGGTVHLLYVCTSPVADHAGLKADLLSLIPADAAARNITVETELVTQPDAAAAICEAAERFSADCLCIGSHTRPGLAAKLMGSVALGVLQHSRRPVLIIPPSEE